MLSKRRYGWPGERLARVAQIGPAMERWREIVENGEHKLQRDFGGVTLTIRKTGVPDAWVCEMPDGKRVIGELHTVRRTVERIMSRSPAQ